MTGEALKADDLVGILLKWADVLDIRSGDFVNEDLRLAAARIIAVEAERDAAEAEVVAEQYRRGEIGLQLEATEARIAVLEGALTAFVDVRDQYPESIKLIKKGVSGFQPISVTVTVDQFRAARAALTPEPS